MCVAQVAYLRVWQGAVKTDSRFKHELTRLNDHEAATISQVVITPLVVITPGGWVAARRPWLVGANGREAGRSLVMCARVAHLSLVIFLER